MENVVDIIKSTPLDDNGKHDLYDRFYRSKTTQELTSYLDSTPLPKEKKAALWDQWQKEVRPFVESQPSAPTAAAPQKEKPGVIGSFLRGAASSVAQGTLGTVGGAAQLLGDVTGSETLKKIGKEYTGAAESVTQNLYGPQGEQRVGGFAQRGAEVFSDPSWWAQSAGEGMGSLLTMIASGGATKAAIDQAVKRGIVKGAAARFAQQNAPAIVAGGAGGLQAAASTYAQAKASGADDATALKAAGMDFVQNAALGAAGAKMGVFGGGSRGAAIARSAVAEPATNVAQAGLSNVIAKSTFDPNRSLVEGVPESVVQGAAAGVPGGLVGSAIQNRRPQVETILSDLGRVMQSKRKWQDIVAEMDAEYKADPKNWDIVDYYTMEKELKESREHERRKIEAVERAKVSPEEATQIMERAIETLDTLVPGTPEYKAVVDAATQAEEMLTRKSQDETRRADQDRLKASLKARQALRNAVPTPPPPERPSTALEAASVLMGEPEAELQRLANPPAPEPAPPPPPANLPNNAPPMAGPVSLMARPSNQPMIPATEFIPPTPPVMMQGREIQPVAAAAPPPPVEAPVLPQNAPPMAGPVMMPIRPAGGMVTPEAQPILPRQEVTIDGQRIPVPEPTPVAPPPPPAPPPELARGEAIPPMAGPVQPFKPIQGSMGIKTPEPTPITSPQARVGKKEVPAKAKETTEKPPERPSEMIPPMAGPVAMKPKRPTDIKTPEPKPFEMKPSMPEGSGKLAKQVVEPKLDEKPGTVKLKEPEAAAKPVEKPVEKSENLPEAAATKAEATQPRLGEDERSDAELQALDIARNRGEELKATRQEAAENTAGVNGVPGSKNTPYAEPYRAARVPVADIAVHPEDFQYKEITDKESGTGQALKDVKQWDEDKAGVISLWYDPQRKENVVINGHHRLALAKRVGQPDVLTKYIRADSPAEARIIGALINIADDKGTAMDAARIFREVKADPALFDTNRLDIQGRVASDGLGLANLTDSLWRKVEQGEIPPEAGAVIGKALDAGKQVDFWNYLRKENETARDMILNNRRRLKSMVDRANAATEKEVQTDQANLFGVGELRSSFKEEADLVDYISDRLSTDKKLFSMVSNSRNAQQLMETGNVLNMSENEKKKNIEAAIKRGFAKLSNLAGPLNRMIQTEALSLMDDTMTQKQIAEIRERSYDAARQILSKELGLESDTGTSGAPGVQSKTGDQGKAGGGDQPAAGSETRREASEPGPAGRGEPKPQRPRVAESKPVPKVTPKTKPKSAAPEIQEIEKGIDGDKLMRGIRKEQQRFSDLDPKEQDKFYRDKLNPYSEEAEKRFKVYKLDAPMRDNAVNEISRLPDDSVSSLENLSSDSLGFLLDLVHVYRQRMFVEGMQHDAIIKQIGEKIGRNVSVIGDAIRSIEEKTHNLMMFGD